LKRVVDRWFRRPPRPDEQVPPPAISPGLRLYCVGDIHGRRDLLDDLHEKIVADAADFRGGKKLVYLGDYIDRGLHSREVIDEMLEAPLEGFDTVHLLGNHEQTLLDFLEYPKEAAGWLAWGGRETLMSYGVPIPTGLRAPDPVALRDGLRERIPDNHVEFLGQMPLLHVEGDYLFVHAGIRPGVALEEQSASDLLWIRQDFIASEARHSHVVVHGHSINEEVEFRANRIGIDTGAFYTGVLTCLVLEGEEQRLLQTGVSR
jgi:serine/threonine protein phosphatase 1